MKRMVLIWVEDKGREVQGGGLLFAEIVRCMVPGKKVEGDRFSILETMIVGEWR
jgi:hypothetical protein